MVNLYSDENVPFPVVFELRRIGHDVVTTQDAGYAGQAVPDEDVLSFAISNQRAVLTLNRQDFIRLHRLNSSHFGIIVCTFDSDFIGQANRIHHAIHDAEKLDGKLLRVNRA